MEMVSIQYIHDEIVGLFAIFFADTGIDMEEQPASKDDEMEMISIQYIHD